MKGEWAGFAPFSLSVCLRSLHQITGVRCTWRNAVIQSSTFAVYPGFTCRRECANDPLKPRIVATHQLINNNEEGVAEFSGSKESFSIRHQCQNAGDG